MVLWQILHAGHSKCMYNFTCPCSYLGVSYFDVEKNYFSWDTFRCIYFSAWLLFSSTFNLQKVETVAREPRLDSFPKVHGFSMPIETLLKTHAHARLRHLLFYVLKKQEIQGKKCVEFQEKISWRTIPDVLNTKKRSHDVPSQMCWIPRKDLMTYHPRCVEFQEKISWRTIPDVLNSKKRSHDVQSQMCWIRWRTIPDMLNSKKRSHDVPSQMCWIPRKDLMTYHPRCVEFQEKISWRTIPDVLNSKKRSHDVPSQMCWIPRKDLMTYHPRCVEFQEKISWRTIPDMLNSKKRSHDVPSQMCWIPRKDLMTYHPRCVEFQEKISWRTIPDVFKSKERYYTPPPPQPTPRQKNNKKRQKKRFHWGETQKKRKKCALAVAPVQWTSKNTVSWRGPLRAPSQLHLYEHKVINQLWRPPHLEHPKTLQHMYFSKMIYWHKLYLIEHKVINQLWRTPHLEHPKTLQHMYCLNDLLT